MYVYIYVEISPGENFTNFVTFYSFMMLMYIYCPLLMIAQRVRRPNIYSTQYKGFHNTKSVGKSLSSKHIYSSYNIMFYAKWYGSCQLDSYYAQSAVQWVYIAHTLYIILILRLSYIHSAVQLCRILIDIHHCNLRQRSMMINVSH